MKKAFLIIMVMLLLIGCVLAYFAYNYIYGKNVEIDTKETLIQIPSNSDFNDLINILKEQHIVNSVESFKVVAQLKKYNKVRAGQFTIKNGWSNNDLINHLRGGKQTPQNVTFNNIRLLDELAGTVAPYFEFDSITLSTVLADTLYFKKYNLKPTEIKSLFIPNTYQMYWNTTPEGFVKRMAKEYDNFWTGEKVKKAQNIGLSKSQVSTLASIVQQEVMHKDEAPKVAGLYLNRLKIGMALQADPTLKFAANDFELKRVLDIHKTIDSPYNTYMYAGLPPGPICIPDIFAIDAVLNPAKHNYLYMCAKEDFSGYHNFATTNAEHERNANRYRAELNKRKIYK